VRLRQQAVNGRDRADARGRLVERVSVCSVGAGEEQQVGRRLEVVLDPVVCLLRKRSFERDARRGVPVRSGLCADRAHEH
jgi:hypothetical protein